MYNIWMKILPYVAQNRWPNVGCQSAWPIIESVRPPNGWAIQPFPNIGLICWPKISAFPNHQPSFPNRYPTISKTISNHFPTINRLFPNHFPTMDRLMPNDYQPLATQFSTIIRLFPNDFLLTHLFFHSLPCNTKRLTNHQPL